MPSYPLWSPWCIRHILRFNYIPSPKLKHRILIDWSEKAIKYWVWLTHYPSDLYKNKQTKKNNYETVSKKIKDDLSNWSASLLSFSARIDIIKMSILPKLLYLCHCQLKFQPVNFMNGTSKFHILFGEGKNQRIRYSPLTINQER